MDRRLARRWLVLSVLCVALASTRFAMGAPNDAAAQKLRDQAIEQDYLATNYTAAEKKLNDALGLCQKTTNCSPFMRARLHCDLGVVEFMLKKLDLARTEFATAIMEDPGVALDPNLSNTDVQREFAVVKNPPASAPSTSGAPAPSPPTSISAKGGMMHVPPRRQAVSTPLPLYVEVPAELGATKVTVRYKPVGAKDWKTEPMRQIGEGYGLELSCTDVGSAEGQLQYFIQAHDANGDLVGASGRSSTPHSVAIVKRLEGEPLHLPGAPPPQACKPGSVSADTVLATTPTTAEASDCPPGFPGCHAEGPTACESKEDCVAGESCVDHTCRRGSDEELRPFKRNWFSLGVQADLLLMPGASDACRGGQHYTCFTSGTSDYYANVPVKGLNDSVLGGLANVPMVRFLLGYDRVILPNVAIGGRIGVAVFGGGPQRPGGASFMPLHVEARIAYWFGRNVFSRKGLRVYAFVAGGMTEVDAAETINVNPSNDKVDAWTKTGLGFGAIGPGLMYAVTANSGIVLEAKIMEMFPTTGTALAAQLGYVIGL
ncbi:MAG: hypothetical protein M3O46_15645 [Myxococcota bacterium]|nr:hypothetical protein [Myxococcota bacterium]